MYLKAIILNQNQKITKTYKTHDLNKLWDCCKNKVDALSEMKIDEYIIMLNRVKYIRDDYIDCDHVC
ncbi:unnamed protein product [marine sediment metagenome]|uniref:Uncharacterized protein n=1 Tax=marine sediment metagenome TaxID=412755 RepID=X1C110_9ZZZZ